jgi:hypothetical protein
MADWDKGDIKVLVVHDKGPEVAGPEDHVVHWDLPEVSGFFTLRLSDLWGIGTSTIMLNIEEKLDAFVVARINQFLAKTDGLQIPRLYVRKYIN